VKDIERAVRFYTSLFGSDGVRKTATIMNSEKFGVGFSLDQTANFEPGDKGPLVYIWAEDDDMEAALAKVELAGGKVISQKTSMAHQVLNSMTIETGHPYGCPVFS
jgi:predicted enzyme related to lactoylglutathione lyase